MHEDKIICYKFASRSRPEKFFKCINNIMSMARHPNYYILCSFDLDDESMNNFDVRNQLDQYDSSRLVYHFGESKNKIDAINRDLENADFDILINMSDDMRFLVAGYDLIILNDFYSAFPKGFGCLAYWDQGKDTKGTGLITMSIFDRLWFYEFGHIYQPTYESLWADNDQTQTSIILKRYHFSHAEIISHDHPANGIGLVDQQYLKTEDPVVHKKDKANFERRKAKNFYVTDKLLSILICTMPEREDMLKMLLLELYRQIALLGSYYQDKVEILINGVTTASIGTKRNSLRDQALGKMIVYFDDDDKPMEDYVSSIIAAIMCYPYADCIGMNGIITTNGKDKRDWFISKEYGSWYEKPEGYYRTPNHISPVRREIADLCPFPEKDFSEDYDYSMKILPYLKHEARINKQLYHYDFRSKPGIPPRAVNTDSVNS